MSELLRRLRIDPYIVAIPGMVVVASVMPVRGQGAAVLGDITKGAIGLLFFLYGARLSPAEACNGLTQAATIPLHPRTVTLAASRPLTVRARIRNRQVW